MAIGTPTSIGVNSFTGTVSGSSITFTTSAAIVAGNLAIIIIALGSNSTPTVSSVSDGTNSYTKAVGLNNGGNTVDCEIWYKENAAAVNSGATVTATLSAGMSGGSEGWVIQGYQASGVATASSLDKTATSATNSTTPSVSSGTLTQADEILFGASYNNNSSRTYTEASGFTNLLTPLGAIGKSLGIGYKIVSSTASVSYAPTWDVSAGISMATILASFKAAATAARGHTPGIPLMGL